MEKDKIREKILKTRKGLSNKMVASNSQKILKKLFGIAEFHRAKKVMFYLSFDNEIDTHWMIEKSLKLKKQIFLPKVVKSRIIAVPLGGIKNLKNLVLGKFGIYEPRTIDKLYCVKSGESQTMKYMDVVIVPGVAFDKNCNRLGFGKGYFDRFLKTQKAIKIGLAHSFQMVKKIPVSKSDVPMNLVITEKQILKGG